MSRVKNSLVMTGIDGLDASNATKEALKSIFKAEVELGNGTEVKTLKINRCKDTIKKGYKNETP
ncbi:hypothetical protein Mpt1_c10140 [Candidatus Methanoplasma termitum]|uniref:Uncharacterized protein n=2 Tax=Candidatus Methanoplasma termitum TaxID=1577791 RepID=A0A0A7LH88_9ARCH|nr:hypothetical protein Mpt1_c10140 [Candidatus Methanoplasma termitum]